MKKFIRSAPRAHLPLALVALMATAVLAACGDDDPTFPSTAPVESLAIQKVPAGAPNLMILVYGDSLRLLGVPTDAEGMFVDQQVTWQSSQPSLADVTIQQGADGRDYAVLKFVANPVFQNPTNVDTVTVTATAGGETAEIDVIVRELPRVETVLMTPVSPFLAVGTQVEVVATPVDGFGNVIEAPSDWAWATTSAGVASVVDNGDGTATVTIEGEGEATVSASVVNAGESPDVGTITGTTDVTVVPELVPGATLAVPTISADGTASYIIDVPAGLSSLVVQIGDASSGDADLYVFTPGSIPNNETTATNFACRPFLVGSNETCTIEDPVAGAWGIRVHAWPDNGDVAGLDLTTTFN